jgi:hypothetical protein
MSLQDIVYAPSRREERMEHAPYTLLLVRFLEPRLRAAVEDIKVVALRCTRQTPWIWRCACVCLCEVWRTRVLLPRCGGEMRRALRPPGAPKPTSGPATLSANIEGIREPVGSQRAAAAVR